MLPLLRSPRAPTSFEGKFDVGAFVSMSGFGTEAYAKCKTNGGYAPAAGGVKEAGTRRSVRSAECLVDAGEDFVRREVH
jgi:hypothetical protein